MGQAKLRAKEIQQLKSQMVDLEIIAIKHYPDSSPEFSHFSISLPARARNSKDNLLAHICLGEWLHNPPVQAIAEYLLQTKTYQLFSQFDKDNGYVINFYKTDPDRPNTFSCRDIMATPRSALKDYARKLAQDLSQNHKYSVREYA